MATLTRETPAHGALAPSGPRRLLGHDDARPLVVRHDAAWREWLIDEVERSGLRGRGGAGFPTARKLREVAARRGPRVVVANGTEGEPLSRKDQGLLIQRPHLVIDGVLAAAAAVRADRAILVVSRGADRAHAAAERAIAERDGGRVALSLAAAPARFVAGQETALVHWLDGGPATPTTAPPRPSQRGVGGRPTLVQNVETLAHLGLIARHGSDWFRGVGTDAEPGTILAGVHGAVARPGIQEIALGTTLGALVEAAGGATAPVAGLLVGGYFGSWIADPDPWSIPMSVEGLRRAGASLGTGMVAVLPEGACGLCETARVSRYLARESAGQCGPCVFGLRALADAAEALAGGRDAAAALREMTALPHEIEGRGACAHPDGAARLARSALRAFPHEVDLHLRGGCSSTGGPPVLPVPTHSDEWR